MNLEGEFTMVGEKLKNETVATFYDVYGVFGPDFGHFSHFPSGLKVIQVLKAKRKCFVKDSAKIPKNTHDHHFRVGISGRDETRFFEESFPEPSAKFEF